MSITVSELRQTNMAFATQWWKKKSLKDKYFHLRRSRLDSHRKPVTRSRVGNRSLVGANDAPALPPHSPHPCNDGAVAEMMNIPRNPWSPPRGLAAICCCSVLLWTVFLLTSDTWWNFKKILNYNECERAKQMRLPKDLLMGFTKTLVLQIAPWLCLYVLFLKASQGPLFARHVGHKEGQVFWARAIYLTELATLLSLIPLKNGAGRCGTRIWIMHCKSTMVFLTDSLFFMQTVTCLVL